MTTTEALIAAHEGKLSAATATLSHHSAELAAILDDLVIRLAEPTGDGLLSVNPLGAVQNRGLAIDRLCVMVSDQVEILEELRRLDAS